METRSLSRRGGVREGERGGGRDRKRRDGVTERDRELLVLKDGVCAGDRFLGGERRGDREGLLRLNGRWKDY